MGDRVTRGSGLLEGFLARKRAAMAHRLLRQRPKNRLLDVGCGTHPYFLLGSGYRERVGIDRVVPEEGREMDGVRILHHDFESDPSLPLPDDHFDAATMLAVFEHVEPAALTPLLADIRRVLVPGGCLVLTTPASWTDPILQTLARLGLVSHEEIDEHKDAYDRETIRSYLEDAGFRAGAIRTGAFELGMNLWARAIA
jgi:SAM-dependent methyltransferase